MLFQTPSCLVCQKFSTVELDDERFARWHGGELIQRAFPPPEFDDGFRELLMTGFHPECWDAFFGEES